LLTISAKPVKSYGVKQWLSELKNNAELRGGLFTYDIESDSFAR